jgi:hypothetical protein
MIFAKESCGHDEGIEYGASEAGKCYDGDATTKRLEEGSIKLPKCLKDMLDCLVSKVNDITQLQKSVLFILDCNRMLSLLIAPLNISREYPN